MIDTLNLTLADLQIDSKDTVCAKLNESKSQDRLAAIEQFFKSPNGNGPNPFEGMTSTEKERAFQRVIDYAERRGNGGRRYDNFGNSRYFTKGPGWFVYTYDTFTVEQSCYDGGSGGTDTVTRSRSLVLEYRGSEKQAWANATREWRKKIPETIAEHNRRAKSYGGKAIESTEGFLSYCKTVFGYHGSLGGDDTPVLPNPFLRKMLLLNPFGLSGVYRILLLD